MRTRAVDYSVRAYQKCLRLYPQSHRNNYGPWMTQLFQDTALDAWREARWTGVASLWLRTFPDILKTAFIERLHSVKGPVSMFQNLTKNPRAAFLTTAIAISSLLFATIVIVTVWLLPVKYASFARVKITPAQTINSPSGSDENIQTEFLIIKSAVTLNEVTKELALDVILAEQLNLNRHLTQDETYRLLVKGIKLQQTCKDLPLIEIWVYDENKFTAATIANMVATVYAKQAIERNRPVNIVDYAKPGLRPKSPNIGLNILVGFPASLLVGILLGAIAGTAVWLWPGIPTSPRNGNH